MGNLRSMKRKLLNDKKKTIGNKQMTQEDLQKMAYCLYEELGQASEHNSCIMASAAFIDMLKANGVTNAYPLTVRVKITAPDGVSVIMIGQGESTEEGWAYHLVAIAPNIFQDKTILFDLSLMQANKPEWGIELGIIMKAVPADFLTGARSNSVNMRGSMVEYQPFPDNDSFKLAPVWGEEEKRKHIVQQALVKYKNN